MRKRQLAYSHGACTTLHDSFCTVYPVRMQRCAAKYFFAISGATQTELPGGRQNLDTGEQLPLMNATKYLSAIPVIALSATKYHVPIDAWLVRLVVIFISELFPEPQIISLRNPSPAGSGSTSLCGLEPAWSTLYSPPTGTLRMTGTCRTCCDAAHLCADLTSRGPSCVKTSSMVCVDHMRHM